MAVKSITGHDRRVAFRQNNALNRVGFGATEQVISITDIISEGPILGLAKGGKSIFLNNDNIFADEETGYSPSGGETINVYSTSDNVVINGWTDGGLSYDPESVDSQYLLIHDAYQKSSSNLSYTSINYTNVTGTTSGIRTGIKIVLGYSGTALPTALTISTTELNKPWHQQVSDGKGWALVSGANGDREVSGWITALTSSSITIYVNATGTNLESLEWIKTEDLSLSISVLKGIASINSNGTITLDSPPPITKSKANFSVTPPVIEGEDGDPNKRKYKSSGFQFRQGTKDQPPIQTLQGEGSSTVALNNANISSLSIGTTQSLIQTGGNTSEIDLIQLIFNYPGGLYLTNTEKGTKEAAGAGYLIELFTQTTSDTSESSTGWKSQGFLDGNGKLTTELISDLASATGYSSWSSKLEDENGNDAEGRGIFKHGGKYTSAVTFTHSINLESYQPFTGFKLEITRITESENLTDSQTGRGHTWPALTWRGPDVDKWQAIQSGGVSQALGVIKEKLNYPYTALANVTFNAKQFPDVPSRTYDCFGLKVKVPHNYTTREEFGFSSGQYPNVVDLYDGLFTGTFRAEKVYTDNPAWVFYDILTNNRYGIGEFLREDPSSSSTTNLDIDVYSLYRIARYCDELVPDGKGGLEPRFRANLYLQKATDAYKVLKDMATIFRGMLYWMDGKIFPIIDEQKSPIYAFNRSNVLNGSFEYQSTGSKTRVNQIVVSWNNPDSDYKLEPLIVEDRENIITTGRVIKETATAFGCTSEGQAIRYGRWKLWTSINQTEIVSFKSAINTAFLAPGDIITIQDNHDFNYKASGRILNEGTGTTSRTLTLDRSATSGATGSYPTTSDKLSLVIVGKKVVLAQDSAVLPTASDNSSTATFNRGDVISYVYEEPDLLNPSSAVVLELVDDSNGTIEQKLSSSFDEDSNLVSLEYITESAVYDCTITAVDSQNNTVTIDLPYTNAVVSKGDIWGIKDSLSTAVSPKEYKILAITRESDNSFGFTAVEYYESKFDVVDNNFTLAVDDPLNPPLAAEEELPAPKNIRILRTPKFQSPGEEITVQWDTPTNSTHVTEFELDIDIPGYPDSLITTSASYSFTEVPDGLYTFRVRSRNRDGRRSKSISAQVNIEDTFGGNHVRVNGLIKGGKTSAPVAIVHNTTSDVYDYKFETSPVYLYSPAALVATARSFSSSVDYTAFKEGTTTLAHVFIDYSSNTIKLANYKFDSDLKIDYWYDEIENQKIIANAAAAEAGDPAPYSGTPSLWTQVPNVTISIATGSNKVEASSSIFNNTAYTEGTRILKFDYQNGVDAQNNPIYVEVAAKIAHVESGTVLYIDRVFPNPVSSRPLYLDALGPDYTIDFLAGRLNKNGEYQSYLTLDPDLLRPRDILVDSNVAFIRYDGNENQLVDSNSDPLYNDITFTVTAFGFSAPEFKITGTGFSAVSGSADSNFTLASDGTYSKTIDNAGATIAWSSGNSLEFTIEVRESQDPDNTNKTKTKNFEIVKVKDGSIGLDGKTVTLEADDYSVIYDAKLENPEYNGKSDNDIDFSATFNNFVDPIWKLTKTVGNSSTILQDWTDANFPTASSKLTIPSTYSSSNWPAVIKLQASEKPENWTSGTAPSSIESSDSISIIAVHIGKGGVTIVNSNSAHSYSTDVNGDINAPSTTATIPNSGTTLEFLLGGEVQTYVGYTTQYGTATAQQDLAVGNWYIHSAICTSGGDLGVGNPTSVSSNVVTIGNHTIYNSNYSGGVTDNTEIITYTIKYLRAVGDLAEIITKQSLSKSIAGTDSTVIELTNDAETVGGTENQALSNLSLSTTAQIFSGTADVSSSWDFTATAATGITVNTTGTGTGGNIFTVTALSSSFTSGNVVITAAAKSTGDFAGSANKTANFTITKVNNGEDGVSYRITTSDTAVVYDPNSDPVSWSPTSVTFSASKITPDGSTSFTSGYWKLNGSNQGQASSVSSGTISSTSGNITAQLYLDSSYTQLVDTESVPIISKGEDGTSVTITSTSTSNGVTTVTFSDNTTITISDGDEGTSEGVLVVYADDANGTNKSATRGSGQNYVLYYEWSGTKPSVSAVTGTWVLFVGDDGETQGVIPVYSSVASPTGTGDLSLTYSNQEYITFFEYTGTKPTAVTSAMVSQTYVPFVGDDGTSVTITSTSTSNGVTTVNFSDGSSITINDGDDGQTQGVKVFYADDASGTNQSTTQGTRTFVKYVEYTGTPPSTGGTSGFVQFIGDDGETKGVIPVYSSVANPTSTASLSLSPGTKEYVTFFEYTGNTPTSVLSSMVSATYVKFVGDDGVGEDGLRTADGYVYYNTATANPPSGPGTSATYTWSSGAITGMSTGWQTSPPEMTAGSQGKYYYSKYRVVQSNSTDTTNTPTFGSVTLGHNFTGLVTFASGDFSQNGSTITQIDGGNIATNTITATQLQISTSTGTSTAGIQMDYNSGNPRIKINDGSATRVILGYLS